MYRCSISWAALVVLLLCLAVTMVAAVPGGGTGCPPGVRQVQCFSDPCRGVTTCPLGCVSDYCGGCNARCACRNKRDCAAGSSCERSGGMVSKSGLGVCAELAPTPTSSPTQVCKYACKLGQQCDPTNGRCVASCSADRACSSAGQYCSSQGVCLASGSCNVPDDCSRDPTLIVPACVGSSTCSAQGKCGYQCTVGAPSEPTVSDKCALVLCATNTVCRDGQCLPIESTPPPASQAPITDKCAVVRCTSTTVCKDGQCVPL